jgi:GNAT superfamily N-acetyltransferase
MRIREAQLGDAPVIAEYNTRLACETEDRELPAATLLAGVRALLEDPAKGLYFVAEEAGEVVGQVMITFEWSDWRNGMFWWLQSVYVREEFRGQGVFHALFEHVRQLAGQQAGVCGLRLYVEQENERAKAAYERQGMTNAGYEVFEVVFSAAAER